MVGRRVAGPQDMRLASDRPVVLIASSDPEAGDQIVRLFGRAGYRASHVSSGEETLTTARDGHVQLVLLDLELPDMTGYGICFELRELVGADLPIIMLSDRAEPTERVAGLLIGADDYLTKPFVPDELLARARRLLVRTSGATSSVESPLTDRESQVLQLLADGKSQSAIAKELFLSTKTVDTHIQRILSKLGVHSRTAAVALAFRQGLIARTEP